MSDPVGRLNQALEGRYTIERKVGDGGMSTVYLVEDLKHRRHVAMKVLLPDLAASVGFERFHREIEIASRLHHPHILALFDSGSADGAVFYTMPYVDGESLRDRLARTGPLPIADAIRIASDVASALTYAHGQGVVHRDVKPGNILLSGRHAIVADFGIARAVEAAGGEALTGTGFVVGTPAYMSPEQALGETDIDGRTDVYALGCVLYEMASGAPPFTGRMQVVVAGHLSSRPKSLRAASADIPLFFERAVERALAKTRDERFGTPDELAEVLASETVVERVGKRRIAVLPPANPSGDATRAALVLGLHEGLISHLGKADVAVLGRTSVLQFEGSDTPPGEIARLLGVDAIVESSLVRTSDSVEVQARLVDGHSEEGLWSGTYRGDVGDLDELGRAIAGSIAEGIELAMDTASRPGSKPTLDPTAYENYMRGRVHQERFTPEDFESALRYYNAVVETHPDHAPSHAGIALVLGSKIVLGLVPALEAGPRWRDAALRAVELDPELSEGHQALAQAYTWFDWDWERAEAEFRKALELDPNDVQARTFYAHYLGARRRHDESIEQAKRAVEIDPFNPFHQTMYGLVLFMARRIDEAMDQLDRSLEMAPSNALARLGQCNCHFQRGEMGRVRDTLRLYCSAIGDVDVATALAPASPSERPEAGLVRGAELLVERSERQFVKPMYVAWMFDWAGDTDRAIRWIERARELRDHEIAYLAVGPLSQRVHAHPVYRKMRKDLDIPPPAIPGSGDLAR